MLRIPDPRSPLAKQVIAKAKVPIVKFVEIESELQFDISFDVANGPAVRPTHVRSQGHPFRVPACTPRTSRREPPTTPE